MNVAMGFSPTVLFQSPIATWSTPIWASSRNESCCNCLAWAGLAAWPYTQAMRSGVFPSPLSQQPLVLRRCSCRPALGVCCECSPRLHQFRPYKCSTALPQYAMTYPPWLNIKSSHVHGPNTPFCVFCLLLHLSCSGGGLSYTHFGSSNSSILNLDSSPPQVVRRFLGALKQTLRDGVEEADSTGFSFSRSPLGRRDPLHRYLLCWRSLIRRRVHFVTLLVHQ